MGFISSYFMAVAVSILSYCFMAYKTLEKLGSEMGVLIFLGVIGVVMMFILYAMKPFGLQEYLSDESDDTGAIA